jgi:hypothetical protein
MITCHQCGKELFDTDEHEPYQWVLVDEYLYCWDCMDEY